MLLLKSTRKAGLYLAQIFQGSRLKVLPYISNVQRDIVQVTLCDDFERLRLEAPNALPHNDLAVCRKWRKGLTGVADVWLRQPACGQSADDGMPCLAGAGSLKGGNERGVGIIELLN